MVGTNLDLLILSVRTIKLTVSSFGSVRQINFKMRSTRARIYITYIKVIKVDAILNLNRQLKSPQTCVENSKTISFVNLLVSLKIFTSWLRVEEQDSGCSLADSCTSKTAMWLMSW